MAIKKEKESVGSVAKKATVKAKKTTTKTSKESSVEKASIKEKAPKVTKPKTEKETTPKKVLKTKVEAKVLEDKKSSKNETLAKEPKVIEKTKITRVKTSEKPKSIRDKEEVSINETKEVAPLIAKSETAVDQSSNSTKERSEYRKGSSYKKSPEDNKRSKNYYKDKSIEIEAVIKAKLDANPATQANFKQLVSISKLMETGMHIGLPSRKWNPKMKKYIYTKKGKNYIIDLYYTVVALSDAYHFLVELGKKDGKALFVGTKGWILKNHIKTESRRVGSFFVNQRWLGGTLTNLKTINNSTKKLSELVALQKFGEISKYSKKEQAVIIKDIEKLNKFFGGIRTMKDLPDVLIVTNPIEEKNAITEAQKLNIPIIAICNTNANPDGIDIVIPANNYSIKSIYLIIGILADAIAIGKDKPANFIGQPDSKIILPEFKSHQ
ncbi:MAG: 30S ribosomal protein S2 [Mycoplasmoidaceae bacterium]